MRHEATVGLVLCILLVASLSAFTQPTTQPEDALVLYLGVEGEPYEALNVGQYGGIVNLFAASDPSGWNPVTTSESHISMACHLFLRGLVDWFSTTREMYGDLAKSWEVSEDGLQVTFHLRRGLFWSDGVPFTADDVLFTYNDLHFNADVASGLRSNMRLPDGTLPVVYKVDDYTIRVMTSVPFRPLLNCFGGFIMPKHKLAQFVHKLNPRVPRGTFNESWLPDTSPEEMVSLGPFSLDSYVPGQHIIFRRNPNYYHFDQAGNRLPYIDGIAYHILENTDAALLRFLNGEIDAFGIRGTDIPFLKPREATGEFTVYIGGAGSGSRIFALNQDAEDEQLRSLFRQLEFRQAIAHALNKEAIVNLVWMGEARAVWSPTTMLSPFYAGRDEYGGPVTEKNAVIYDFDLPKAEALLDVCGILDNDGDGTREFEDGTPVEFTLNWAIQSSTWTESALIYAADLGKIGIRVNLNAIDWGSLVSSLFAGTWESLLIGLSGGEDPHGGSNVFTTTGRLHFWHFSAASGDPYPYEERFDELYALGAGTFDVDEAFEYYKEIQTRFAAEDLGVIYTVSPGSAFAVRNKFGNAEIFQLADDFQGSEICHLIYMKEATD